MGVGLPAHFLRCLSSFFHVPHGPDGAISVMARPVSKLIQLGKTECGLTIQAGQT